MRVFLAGHPQVDMASLSLSIALDSGAAHIQGR